MMAMLTEYIMQDACIIWTHNLNCNIIMYIFSLEFTIWIEPMYKSNSIKKLINNRPKTGDISFCGLDDMKYSLSQDERPEIPY